MGQILSNICGETFEFDTSLATRNYSSDGQESENEAGSRTVLLPWKVDEEQNPLIYQQREEVCHLKDLAINKKWKKKFVEDSSKINEAIVEDGVSIKDAALLLRKGEQEKPVFQVHIDPAAKEGNGKPLVDQNNEQRNDVGYSKDVTLKWKEIVEEGSVNEPIIKCEKEERDSLNVTKKKEIVENRCNNEAIIKSLNVKKKEIDENFHNYGSSGSSSSSDSTVKDENGKPVTNQSNIFYKNKTINEACNLVWRKKSFVIDDGKNEPIINAFISTKKKKIDENEENPLITKAKGSVFQVCVAAKSGIDNHLADQRNKKIDHAVKRGNENPLADQKNKQRIEDGHHKDVSIKKTRKKKNNNIVEDKSKNGDKVKPVIFPSSRGPLLFKAHIDPAAKKGKDTNHHKKTICVDNNEIVWLKHYNNKQKILMVGEGDFSFSASLAVAFGSSASNITATSFNNSVYLRCNYKKSTGNIEELTSRGATVRHGFDATKMSKYLYWKDIKFDRIIYNFPYSGCPKTESRQTQMRQHLELVRGFLLNAKEMLTEGGEIHISHKTNGFHSDWKLKELAWLEGLWLVGEAEFNRSDYPGYETKQGYNGDLNFDCQPSSTYMFASISIDLN